MYRIGSAVIAGRDYPNNPAPFEYIRAPFAVARINPSHIGTFSIDFLTTPTAVGAILRNPPALA